MMNKDLYAVITGDIIGSSKFKARKHDELLSALKLSFKTIEDIWPDVIFAHFEIYRGDSFQGVLSKPEKALHVAIFIRASFRYYFQTKRRRDAVDARIVVGIGSIDSASRSRVAEGDGEAFRRSGPILDEIEQKRRSRKRGRLLIQTPWPDVNAELDVECALLDALINRWSAQQAVAIIGQIQGLTQEKAAEKLGISQPANSQRLVDAGGQAIRKLCHRYETVIRGTKKRKESIEENNRGNL